MPGPTNALRTILLATDGSEHSEKALQEAINLATSCGTKVYVLSVVEVNPEYEALAPKIVERYEDVSRRSAEVCRAGECLRQYHCAPRR